MPPSYTCSHCGRRHEGLPTDWGFKLPDDVHELGYLDRYASARHNGDLCTLDESRFFIRTLLRIPILEGARDSFFNWGVWVEVDKAAHDLYVRSWDEDISAQPRAEGRLANRIQAYEGAMALPVEIEFHPGTDRPSVWLKPDVAHALALEQRNGITGKRHHDILAALGHFGDERDA